MVPLVGVVESLREDVSRHGLCVTVFNCRMMSLVSDYFMDPHEADTVSTAHVANTRVVTRLHNLDGRHVVLQNE